MIISKDESHYDNYLFYTNDDDYANNKYYEMIVSYKNANNEFVYSYTDLVNFYIKYKNLIESNKKFSDIYMIYIIGSHRAGKSTFARLLKSKIKEAYLLSFSRPMKLNLYKIFTKKFIEEKSPEVRLLLQAYGEAKRAQTKGEFFIKTFYNVINNETMNFNSVIVDDVYHLNERFFLNLFPKRIEVLLDYDNDLSSEDHNRVSIKELSILLKNNKPDFVVTNRSQFDEVTESIKNIVYNIK